MKFILFATFAALYMQIECRKIVPPIQKTANTAFINMEGGGVPNIAPKTAQVAAPKPVNPPTPVKTPTVVAPSTPAPVSVPKPTEAAHKPTPVAVKPNQTPTQAKQPVGQQNTTPGPGSVKQLVNFYDSQGKHSAIRPYSYSQAVKQG